LGDISIIIHKVASLLVIRADGNAYQQQLDSGRFEGTCLSVRSAGQPAPPLVSEELSFSPDHQHLIADLEEPEERFDQRQG
jgi:hypothetical protein